MAADGASQEIRAASGITLRAAARCPGPWVEIELAKLSGAACMVHWGVIHAGGSAWQRPPGSTWPPGSAPALRAVETPLDRDVLRVRLKRAWRFSELRFVLLEPNRRRWDNNQGRDYRVTLPEPPPLAQSPAALAQAIAGGGDPVSLAEYALGEGYQLGVALLRSGSGVRVGLACDVEGPLYLHWGVATRRRAWQVPPVAMWPPGTRAVSATAVETPLGDHDNHDNEDDGGSDGSGLRVLRLDLPGPELPPALAFVLRQPEQETWWKVAGGDLYLPTAPGLALAALPASLVDGDLRALADEIVAREGSSSFSLMHRFNLAHDLLDRVPRGNAPGLGLIFVWLRFSALRALDWQRNYNTKPRELAHAQDRLTIKLSERAAAGEPPALLRMIASTVGRGGDGQRVRDGILEIMHRHHIKEVAGHFLEEWHQKLHNNTTPDDVVICEAYLEFLRGRGREESFYGTLAAGGVTAERLLSFERPIRSHPEYIPELRDALLADFTAFLAVLRSLHAATDLGSALAGARTWLDEPARQLLDGIWRRREEPGARVWLLESVTRAREIVAARSRPGQGGLRDLFYLDLALEDFFRVLVERSLHVRLGLAELVAGTELALRNLLFTRPQEELPSCLGYWHRVAGLAQSEPEWALHAQAALERVGRVLVEMADSDVALLQPIADALGPPLAAPSFTIAGFAEEVLRGRLEFVVSALLRKLDEGLREHTGTGRWRIISRGSGDVAGIVVLRGSLAEAQEQHFGGATVLVVGRVGGEEEIPPGVVAVLTEASVDLLAHVAVRARNAQVQLATARDRGALDDLRAQQGKWVRVTVSREGDVAIAAAEPAPASEAAPRRPVRARPGVSPGSAAREYAIGEEAFTPEKVGSKSRNLKELRARLPGWISVPAGVVLPYGVCERVLGQPANQALAERQQHLLERLAKGEEGGGGSLGEGASLGGGVGEGGAAGEGGANGEGRDVGDAGAVTDTASILGELRRLTMALELPEGLEVVLRGLMSQAGIPCSSSFPEVWSGVKRVWASKWNERAFASRRAFGLPDASLQMAVLLEPLAPAELSFVIHTTHPITLDRDELAAEVVLGLGETLVGNHPGRALGFTYARNRGALHLTSLPSKSRGLFGQGLALRSDFSGEDLVGFAGAGLYDTVTLPPARAVTLDYQNVDWLWDRDARERILRGIAEVGMAVEQVFGVAQDIEGTYGAGRFFVVQARPQVGLDGR